ncbi:MAG: response regulator [Oscillospiraceae bacterium]|nr:response regulator [Oscillospiraceae bacterium]
MIFPRKPIIFAVDDDKIIREHVETILAKDYIVKSFDCAKAALKELKANPADLILVDFNMPEMTGLQMLEAVLADRVLKEIPVIFLTGSAEGDDEVQALRTGALDYITKPIRPEVLLTRLGNQLELQNYRKNLEKLVRERTHDLNEALTLLKLREDVTLNLLARVTEMRDSETGCHIERTTEFVRIIVDELLLNPSDGYNLTKDQGNDIIKSAKLHDLGKIAIPDGILLKPGKLEPFEFEIIKTHTTEGEKLLSGAMDNMKMLETNNITHSEGSHIVNSDNFLKTACDITYNHHEKWNGNGYPRGLKEAEIPLSARIVAIADVYDALTSKRPYKEPFSHEESAKIISDDSGQHFDPHLIEIFKKHHKEFEKISKS